MAGTLRSTMRKDWAAKLEHVTFRCGVCRHAWEAQPDLVEPDAGTPHHPHCYFAHCPGCKAQHQPQAPWERALMKAHQASTGPKTAEGRAAAAANLDGHPTPEEARRTRFNAMKHGLHARQANYFPAKPDGYAFCARCDVDRTWCGDQPACVKQTELFMLTHAAFDQRDPKVLGRVHADLHAALVASLQMCLQAVLGDGAVIRQPKVTVWEGGSVSMTYVDAAGERQPVYEYFANPAFKPIADLVTRLGLSLADLGMTQKAGDDDEQELRGRLGGAERSTEVVESFADRMAASLGKLRGQIDDARAAAARDPVLLEHQAQTGAGTG